MYCFWVGSKSPSVYRTDTTQPWNERLESFLGFDTIERSGNNARIIDSR